MGSGGRRGIVMGQSRMGHWYEAQHHPSRKKRFRNLQYFKVSHKDTFDSLEFLKCLCVMGVARGWQSHLRSPRPPCGILPLNVKQPYILGILLFAGICS